MASPFQQQSLRRKLIYLVLIIALFSTTLLLRTSASFGLEKQAQSIELREADRGEVELTGSAIRLGLTGSRGLVMCLLWKAAIDKQAKHEWNELELLVNSLTTLQPHFITPWLFQSWNLAYNVSVESDRIRDKYFYMTRGIQLLADGERQNRNNPDLRFSMGFYNQHKIGLSDEGNTLRCLFEMSCMDPVLRDPNRLRSTSANSAGGVDMAKFREFCQRYPFFVRRLHEVLKLERPSEIVDFLADNQKIPSRYEDRIDTIPGVEPHGTLKPAHKQFPVLPPAEAASLQGDRGDPDAADFDNFTAARDWYLYSIEPLPPPVPDLTGGTPAFDPRKYRLPRYMATHLFRGYPARGQTYIAEQLEKEGWFDQEGWRPKAELVNDNRSSEGSTFVVGEGTNWAARAWSRAHAMYRTHGESTGLYLEPEAIKTLEQRAKKYRDRFGPAAAVALPDLSEKEKAELKDSFDAHVALFWYQHYREMTNFAHFYFKSQAEADPKTIKARKALFQAEQLRNRADHRPAMFAYRDALEQWREVLLAHPDFRRDPEVERESYEAAVKYLGLLQHNLKSSPKDAGYATYLLTGNLTKLGNDLPVGVTWIPPIYLMVKNTPFPFATPLDGTDAEGEPLVSDETRFSARAKLGYPVPPRPVAPTVQFDLPGAAESAGANRATPNR